jgi:MYXO-CTERM domain-containing protein
MKAQIVQAPATPPQPGARAVRATLAAFAAASAFAIGERPAQACGGCFIRPQETTVVTDHRMAFSVSTQQTVLWDQIKYSGNPSDFSWVLPVQPGAVVQLSNDEWFAALDAMTSPVISGPSPNCGSAGGGCGFASSNSVAGLSSAGAENGVQVISQSVVGPYQTVTLQSADPSALESWLNANGYALPDAIRPTVAAYVGGGFDFIALRLLPNAGVQSMKPVRVVTAGADATLPLRMVAAGVGAEVGITLYVISEGRYEAQSPFFNAVIDDSQLTWSALLSRSNYQAVSQQLMQGHVGRTWLTEFSGPASLLKAQYGRSPYCGAVSYVPGQSLADVYLAQCLCKVPNRCAGGPPADAGLAPGIADAAAEASGADAGCNPDPCAGFDDLDVALVGIHPQDSWVTRMRAILPVQALSEGDLHIQASASQSPVTNQHAINVYDDPNYRPCGTKGGCSASATQVGSFEKWLVAGIFGLAGVALVRRRRR